VCPYRYVAVVGVMIALLVIFGSKIGYSWVAAGEIIFKAYFYALATINIDL
jgi:hypothetical protein